MALTSYGRPLAPVSSFKCLGIIMLVLDYGWPVLVRNPRKARKKWELVMGREGVDPRMSVLFYIAVVQVVLIYGLEM